MSNATDITLEAAVASANSAATDAETNALLVQAGLSGGGGGGGDQAMRAFIEADTAAREVIFPQGITRIGSYAYNNCTYTTPVVIPDTVTEIGESGMSLRRPSTDVIIDITVPRSVQTIASAAFGGTAITLRFPGRSIASFDLDEVFLWCRNASGAYLTPTISLHADDGTATFEGFGGYDRDWWVVATT